MVDGHKFAEILKCTLCIDSGIKGHLRAQQQNKNTKNKPHTGHEIQKPG
jgi:hypothetical protein